MLVITLLNEGRDFRVFSMAPGGGAQVEVTEEFRCHQLCIQEDDKVLGGWFIGRQLTPEDQATLLKCPPEGVAIVTPSELKPIA